jgi:hypothetical protein
MVVPETGIEPVWTFIRGILSPLRLPIPPLRQYRIYDTKKNVKKTIRRGPASVMKKAGTASGFLHNSLGIKVYFFLI